MKVEEIVKNYKKEIEVKIKKLQEEIKKKTPK